MATLQLISENFNKKYYSIEKYIDSKYIFVLRCQKNYFNFVVSLNFLLKETRIQHMTV